jgi:MFS family permease
MARLLPAATLTILALNLAFTARLFVTEYSSRTESIEAAYIAISHQWMTHGIGLSRWFPLWYGGIPGQNTYPPLLHVLVALVGKALGISAASSHHAVTAVMYCLGALTAMWLAWVLSGSRIAAALAGLLITVTSFSAWLMPSVRHDLGSVFGPRRLQVLTVYGEGPHVMSMALLPVAIVLLHFALTRRRPLWVVLAAAGLASVVLTNWLGGFALAAAAFAYLLAFHRPPAWLGAAAIGVYAYVLASPWIPPSTLQAVRVNAQRIGGDFRFGAANLLWLAGLLAACFALDALLRRARASRFIRFSASFFLLMGAIALLAEWFGINVVPQPSRYHVEMEMALCLLAGGVFSSLPRRAMLAAAAAVAVLAVAGAVVHYRASREFFRPIDMRATSEYKMSRWFDEHMDGRRVFAPSAVQFWLNAFADTPQFGGGFAQGIIDRNRAAADFQIMSGMGSGGREGQIAVDWLRAYGVHAVGVTGPRSTEYYKSIRNWKKFDGVLRELWRDGDDVVYEVPQRSASLARVVRPEQLVAAAPEYANDTAALAAFLQAIDDPALPEASWTWVSRSQARIQAELAPGQVVLVQMNYHPGWSATANGRSAATRPDGLDQLVIEPRCDGPCAIELDYDGGAELRLARWASALSALVGLHAIVRSRFR